jgi:ribosomal protein S18 acetylase RimI-like enzyme
MNIQIKKSTDIPTALSIAKKNPHYFNPPGLEAMKIDFNTGQLMGAYSDSKMVGFINFKELNNQTVELVWMAVDPDFQDQGIGGQLIKEGIELLPKKYLICETKTLSEIDPDPKYARTRNFYFKQGFIPLETINPYPGWGKDNPCQLFVKVL